MRSAIDRRLVALERASRPREGWPVIVYQIIEPDRSLSPVTRYESSDGQFSWTRAPGEAIVGFIERVREEAKRLAVDAPLALMPRLEGER